MTTKNKTIPTATVEVTEAQITAWKKQHGDVFAVTTEDGKVGYIRRPDRRVIAAAAVMGGNDNIKQKEVLIRNCWLGGDDAIQNEDKYFLALMMQVDAIIEVAQVELKKV